MSKRVALSVLAGIVLASSAGSAPALAAEPIQPIEPAKIMSPGMVELGKKLFFDPRDRKSVV